MTRRSRRAIFLAAVRAVGRPPADPRGRTANRRKKRIPPNFGEIPYLHGRRLVRETGRPSPSPVAPSRFRPARTGGSGRFSSGRRGSPPPRGLSAGGRASRARRDRTFDFVPPAIPAKARNPCKIWSLKKIFRGLFEAIRGYLPSSGAFFSGKWSKGEAGLYQNGQNAKHAQDAQRSGIAEGSASLFRPYRRLQAGG